MYFNHASIDYPLLTLTLTSLAAVRPRDDAVKSIHLFRRRALTSIPYLLGHTADRDDRLPTYDAALRLVSRYCHRLFCARPPLFAEDQRCDPFSPAGHRATIRALFRETC